MREDDADDPLSRPDHVSRRRCGRTAPLEGMGPIAQQLMSDTLELQQLVNDPSKFAFDAAQVANGSTELLDEVAQSKITGEEERYSASICSTWRPTFRARAKATTWSHPA